MYSDDQRVWNRLFEMFAADLAEVEKGIDLGRLHGVVYPIVLGNKGDWSYLVPWSKDVTIAPTALEFERSGKEKQPKTRKLI